MLRNVEDPSSGTLHRPMWLDSDKEEGGLFVVRIEHRRIPLESATKRTSIQNTLAHTGGASSYLYPQGSAGKGSHYRRHQQGRKGFGGDPNHNWYPLNGVGGLVDVGRMISTTRNSLTFVNTVVASGQKAGWSLKTLAYGALSTSVIELRVGQSPVKYLGAHDLPQPCNPPFRR